MTIDLLSTVLKWTAVALGLVVALVPVPSLIRLIRAARASDLTPDERQQWKHNIVTTIGGALIAILAGIQLWVDRAADDARARQRGVADAAIKEQTDRAEKRVEDLRSTLENETALRLALENDLAEAREKQHEDTAKQVSQLRAAEGTITAIQQEAMPRVLTSAQKQQLVTIMAAQPKAEIDIVCMTGNAESCNLAKQLELALREAGFLVRSSDMIEFGFTSVGVYLVVAAPDSPRCGPVLQQQLIQFGLGGEARLDSKRPIGSLQIIVGHKPRKQPAG